MKRNILKLCLLILFCIQYSVLKSQDLQFSQFGNSSLLLNPALTGAIDAKMRLSTNYKNQWSSISSPFRTFGLAYDVRFSQEQNESGFLGLGLTMLSDKAGASRMGSNQANLAIAYHVRLDDDNYLSAGLIAGVVQRGYDHNNLEWNSQFDGTGFDASLPSYNFDYVESRTYADIGVGLNWSYSTGDVYASALEPLKINAGFSAYHLNKQDLSVYFSEDYLPIKLVAYTDAEIRLNWQEVSFIPSFLYIRQGASQNIITGLVAKKVLQEGSKITGISKQTAISLGCLYRVGDAFIPYFQLEMSSFKLGVSYDVNSSSLSGASMGRGGVELSLSWLTGKVYRY